MSEPDPLDSLLREWKAPDPPASMDERVRAAFRANRPVPAWRRLWSARVSVPVPALAALLLVVIVAAFWFQNRFRPPVPQPAVAAPGDGYTTRIEVAGFRPLPDGAARVIRAEGVKQ